MWGEVSFGVGGGAGEEARSLILNILSLRCQLDIPGEVLTDCIHESWV